MGAPVVNPEDGGLIAGNTRTKMVQLLAERNPEKLGEWKAALQEAAPRFGLDPGEVAKVKAPVLVRVLEGTQAEKVGGLVEEANRSITTSLSATEQAAANAVKIPDTVFDSLRMGEDEGLRAALQRPGNSAVRQRVFGLLFPRSEWPAVLDPKTRGLSQEALARIENAITAKALNLPKDSPALNAMLISTEAGVNNLKAASLRSAGALLKGRSYLSARAVVGDPFAAVGKAVEKFVALKDAGKDVDAFLSGYQGSLFGEPARTEGMGPAGLEALRQVNDLAKSPKKLREFLAGLGRAVEQAPKKGQLNLLGEQSTVTVGDILHAARKGADEGKGPVLYSMVIPGLTDARVEALARRSGEVVAKSLEKEVLPAVRKGALGVARTGDDIRKLMAPQARGAEALTAANLVREANARLARRYERAVESMKVFQKAFISMPREEALGFIDRLERGMPQGDPRLDRAARVIRNLMDSTWKKVQEVKGTEAFIKNYFPHVWKDPEAASSVWARIFGHSSLEGSKSFLKKRSVPTTAEGIEMGLEPVSYNPVDLALLKYHEMNRYLMGHEILEGLQGLNLTKYVRIGEVPEPGYTLIHDKIGTIYGPPKIGTKEAFDKKIFEGLSSLAASLKVPQRRVGSMGGSRWGEYSLMEGIKTRFVGPEAVLAHEIGHAIDTRFGLWDRLTKQPEAAGARGQVTKTASAVRRRAIGRELRALSDLYWEGEPEPSESHQKYLRKREEKIAHILEAYVHAPEKLKETAPTVFEEFQKVIDEHPELRPLRDIKPSLVLGERGQELTVPGLRIMGNYYAPAPVSHVLNNFLSPGLRGKPLYDAMTGVGNTLNQANLGLSGFHLIFTTGDAMVSKTALGIEQLFQRGRRAEGLANIFRGISPHTPAENLIRGHRLYNAYLKGNITDPRLAQLVDALVAGGGRVKMDAFYKNNSIEKFLAALRERRPLAAGVHSVPATLELVAKPLMEWIVPRQKLGVFADLATNELFRLGPEAKREVVRAAMAKAWDSVDNRMGQLVYDNLFWHKALKDLGMVSVRSLGWNLGTVRELGGAVVDAGGEGAKVIKGQAPEMTHRMAYAVALPFVTGLYGALIHYLYTGERPDDLKDYYFPRTGRKNQDGSDERLALPSYMKDVATAALGFRTGPSAGLKGMAIMASHKVHPMVSAMFDMLRNEDFYGTEIRHQGDPLVQQAMGEAAYMVKQFVPFSVTGYRKRREAGEGIGQAIQSFAGLQPASGLVTKTLAQHLMQGYLADMMPEGARTKEAFEASQRRKELRGELRRGEEDARAHLREAWRSGEVTPRQARDLLKTAKQDPRVAQFTRLPLDKAVEVWKYATPEEKRLWARLLMVKGRNAMKNATPKRRREIVDLLIEVREDYRRLGDGESPGGRP